MSRTTLAQHVWMLYQRKSSRVIMWTGFVLGCIWWMSQTILVGLQSTPGALWDRSSSSPIRGIAYQPIGKWMLNGLLKTNTLSLTYAQSMFGGSGAYTTLFKGKSGKLYFSTYPKQKDWNHQLIYIYKYCLCSQSLIEVIPLCHIVVQKLLKPISEQHHFTW